MVSIIVLFAAPYESVRFEQTLNIFLEIPELNQFWNAWTMDHVWYVLVFMSGFAIAHRFISSPVSIRRYLGFYTVPTVLTMLPLGLYPGANYSSIWTVSMIGLSSVLLLATKEPVKEMGILILLISIPRGVVFWGDLAFLPFYSRVLLVEVLPAAIWVIGFYYFVGRHHEAEATDDVSENVWRSLISRLTRDVTIKLKSVS